MNDLQMTIVGAGSWGTALAVSLHNAQKKVALWARRECVVDEIKSTGQFSRLPGIPVPKGMVITNNVNVISQSSCILWAVPVQQSHGLLQQIQPAIAGETPLILCSKGLELERQEPLSKLFQEILSNQIGVLSGPNFADEVARNLPTASTLAFNDLDLARHLAECLRHKSLRIYAHHDVTGIELSGALKNVAAIAAGIVIGTDLGHNCLASLITRANAEISRFCCALGGMRETSQTLAGMGDLILTCSSEKSRNTSLGIALAKGQSLEDILDARKNVTEGVATTEVAYKIAKHLNIHTPIINAVYSILYERLPIQDVMNFILSNQQQQEFA